MVRHLNVPFCGSASEVFERAPRLPPALDDQLGELL